ncbi:MAG: 23S rRNA (adenine(2503)-C(2))-methyltransferase RlmN [Candidatus Berkiellales bacterium]
MSEKINLLGLDQKALANFMVEIGEKPFRALQIIKWIHQEGISDFALMTNLSKDLRQLLSEKCIIQAPEVISEHLASDGTRKWLFRVPGGSAIETVYIPEPARATLCISSQIGCALNCRFCHTAQQGFQRNLTSAEIIGQLWFAVKTLKAEGNFKAIDRPITNVVFMGMGEPLLNFDNVILAVNIMLDDLAYGLSKRRVTISTSGVAPAILQLKEVCDVALALSLHAPNDDLRTQIVPLNKKYPIAEVLSACKQYLGDDKRRRITIEYVMLAGINDQPHHAYELKKLLRGYPAKVNLIPFNPFLGTIYQRSDPQTISHFQTILMEGDLITTTRKTRGDDIDAACGQLAGQVNDRTQRSHKFKQSLQTRLSLQVVE